MKRILILSMGLLFAAELEVDGVIKANSGIDANNNPITNVGSPLTMSDAINGNVLQDALRDDGNNEYKMYMIKNLINDNNSTNISFHRYEDMNENNWNGSFHIELISLSSDGWSIHYSIPLASDGQWYKAIIVFKRPISEEE